MNATNQFFLGNFTIKPIPPRTMQEKLQSLNNAVKQYMPDVLPLKEVDNLSLLKIKCKHILKEGGIGDTTAVLKIDNLKVLKFYQAERDVKDRLERLQLHNKFFGNQTPYTIEGWSKGEESELLLVVSQPYIECEENSFEAAQKQLLMDLLQRFNEVRIFDMSRCYQDWMLLDNGQEYSFGDLKAGNVCLNAHTGTYAVIDCIIHNYFQETYHWNCAEHSYTYNKGTTPPWNLKRKPRFRNPMFPSLNENEEDTSSLSIL